jgi:ferritin
MQSHATIEADLALDEGSQVNLGRRDPFSVAGCVVLFDRDRDRLREVVSSRSVPKWKNATSAHVEAILDVFESTQARALVRIFERTEDGLRRLKEALEEAIRHEKEVAQVAQLFLKDTSFDESADGIFRLVLLGSAAAFLYKASVEEVVRTLPKTFIDVARLAFRVWIDRYSAPDSHVHAVRGAFARYAGTERKAFERLPKIEFQFCGAELVEETQHASLILVDHLTGIVASQTIPKYQMPAGLAGAPAAEWHERLLKNPRLLVLRTKVESLMPEIQAAQAAGQELVRQAKELKADVLGEPRDGGGQS